MAADNKYCLSKSLFILTLGEYMKVLFILASLTIFSTAYGEVLTVNPKRLVKIIGNISMGSASTISNEIHNFTADASKEPVFIMLNSPGGVVPGGLHIIDAINAVKANNIKVKCFVGSVAASMAFAIFTFCDERYSLANSGLLFHPMSLSVSNRKIKELYNIMVVFTAVEDRLKAHMRKILGMDEKLFEQHYQAETLWGAEGLNKVAPGFVKVVDDIKGVSDLFTSTKGNSFFQR